MITERTPLLLRTALAALVLASLASGAAAQDPAAAPRASVEQAVFDVGNVPKGKPVRHDFVIRNNGDADLEITEVKPSCGCTVTDHPKRIAPGGSGAVTLVVKTTDFTGPIAKSAAVFTNDPATPRIQLVIKANIRAEIEASPGYARFLVVQGEEFEATEHRLTSVGEQPFEVLEVTSPVPYLTAEVSGEGAEWTLRLELADNAPIGPIADFVVVTTDHPAQSQVRLPVSGFVRPPVVVIPQIYDFGRRKIEEPYPGRVQVKVVASGEVRLGEVSTDLEGVQAEVEEVEAGKLYNLVILLEPGLAAGPTEGTVTVRTDSQRYPVLEIPIRGTVL